MVILTKASRENKDYPFISYTGIIISERKGASWSMEVVSYLFFGVMTTLVNFIVYFFCRDLLQFQFVLANTFSWIASVLFAFLTNKKWVFHSKSETKLAWIIEAAKFIFYRGLSYLIDMASMFVCLKLLMTSDFSAKLFTQVLVVIANYFFSKLLIFNNNKK